MKLKIARTLSKSILVMTLAAGAQTAMADATRFKADYERRLESVKALSDSLARDPAAGGAEAKASLAAVAARRKEAEDLAAVGEYEVAKSILDEGYRKLTQTLSSIKTGSGYSGPTGSAAAAAAADPGKKAAYEREISSAKALLDAARRANTEAGGAKTADITRIDANIGKAEKLAAGGDFVQAESLASDALKELRPLIAGMKGGKPAEAAPAAGGDAQDKAKLAAGFDNRMLSAKAMADALKRQNKEKGAGKDALIAEIEGKLSRAESMKSGDIAAASALLDEAYNSTKGAIQSMQSASTLKSGSAAMETANSGSGDTGAELERSLKSSRLLRDSIERMSREKGVDNAATLARIDKLTGEAQAQRADTGKAMATANEAYRLAREALDKLRGM